MKTGVLLLYLGTPSAPDYGSVFRYLREFLSDSRVIPLPALLRYLLLYGFILPFRTAATTQAYRAIWTPQGSPLRYHSEQLRDAVQAALGPSYDVVLGMRYGAPKLAQTLERFSAYEQWIVLPLYPHYASATTGSALIALFQHFTHQAHLPSLTIHHAFDEHPAFIQALAQQIRPYLDTHDYLLFSYHGLPAYHLKESGCSTPCQTACPAPHSHRPWCYRARCFHTSRQVAAQLNLSPTHYGTAFQSRLGRTEWIKPYTDHLLIQLRKQGIQRLAITCPSFVVDCLETLEEIGLRAKETWLTLGGEQLTLIPALNASPLWVDALCQIIRANQANTIDRTRSDA